MIPLPICSQLPLAIELPPLLAALARVPGTAWQHHFNTGYYDGDWSGVALVAAEDAHLPLASGLGAPRRTDWWQGEAAWEDLLGLFGESVRSARLLRLGAGARIHEHRDYDLGQPGADLRLHVPLLSPPEVEFLVEGLRVPMQPGQCWFIDLSRPHRVDNYGTSERVHLVLDCRPDDWLLKLVAQGLPVTPALLPGRAIAAFERFRQLVVSDAGLARQLQALSEPEAFIRATVELGAAAGLVFSESEVKGAMRRGKQAWSDQWRA
ncbi:hypothetical protein HNP29_000769 [Pseudomonas alcaligenes]|nr:hypothetical protein [Pseudomonas alcaligenes]